ncbi:thiamine pyrophosphokinase [Cyclobacterium jeungdonense]|uniref:Thiamine pyrophosphokinase n=1 Tax=Cyclobacterium jeungdonense TaxID=708087 RepID=A0ABT8CD14_9BACT|nr:thiamine pyrophosphokinase [Cyclobacterium jeungdonense]MDN3689640.1 thiamine pyrophosphokinase [Cyclobacterium jeungdonense]
MSSHHFVKEKQEPALLIIGRTGWDFQELQSLLEWVPTILVTEENVLDVLSLGIKVDVILATQKFQQDNPQLAEEQFPVNFITVPTEQFLSASLHYLIQSGHNAVNILPYDPLDHSLLEPYLKDLDIVFFHCGYRYFAAKQGSIKKWLPSSSIQVLGEEGQFVEHQSPGNTQIFPIRYLTTLELNEGMQRFSSNKMFWLGTCLEFS